MLPLQTLYTAKPPNNPSHQGVNPLDPHVYLGALNLEDSINAPLRFGNSLYVGTVMANFARHQMCLKSGEVKCVLREQLGINIMNYKVSANIFERDVISYKKSLMIYLPSYCVAP